MLLAGPVGAKQIAVDNVNNKIYYTVESGTTSIYSANLDGTFPTTLFTGITQDVSSIKVYPQYGKIYYVRSGVGIHGMNVDGTGDALVTGSSATVEDFVIETDFVAPTITTLLPLDGAVNVIAYSNLSMTFNENIKVSTTPGTLLETSIRIFKTVGNVPIDTIARGSSNISVSGAVATINPAANLDPITDYYILVGSKVFSDLSGNNFGGVLLPTAWNFTTAVDNSQFYSRQTGNYSDPNSWTHYPTHSGPAASSVPGSTGEDAFIGGGHTLTMTGNINIISSSSGLTIESGSTLNAAGFDINISGDLNIIGTLNNVGYVRSNFGGVNIFNTSGDLLILQGIILDDGLGGEIKLHSDIVLLNGITTLSGGTLNPNGFKVCDATIAPPVTPIFTNKKATSVTLSWTKIAPEDAFIVARQGATPFKPTITSLYNANTVFGSGDAVGAGNFVVYKGPGTSVDITGLLANSNYEFDMYSYSTIVGGCYNVNNYQFASLTSCGLTASPTNPIDATYCVGDTKPAVSVDVPAAGKTVKWYDAATFGNIAVGATSGLKEETFTPTAATGTFYAELYDAATECTSDVRVAVTLTQNPAIVIGTATGSQAVCVGDDPTLISGGGAATGGNGTYTYQWRSSTVSSTGPFTDISGEISLDYDPPSGFAATTYYLRRARSGNCSAQLSNVIAITLGAPTNVTGLANTPGDAQITLNWSNPVSCFDEVLIVAKQSGTPTAIPVGDGTAYTANAVFGNGTAVIPGEFAVYKGNGSSVIVTGLTNSISHTFKIFTRKGSVWSSGVTTSGTGIPTPPVLAFTPVNGATNVIVVSNLTISFDEPVRNLDNSTIDNSNVSALLALKLTNAGGANVPFTATINGTKDLITIDPTASLLPSQVYYLSILPVEDSNNNATLTSNITFTTQAGPTITNVAPVVVCAGLPVIITGTNFGTAVPTVVSASGTNIPVTAHTQTSISLLPSAALSGVLTVTNNDISLNTVSSASLTVSDIPNVFSITGGGPYCVGASGVQIGLSNSQAGVEYEVFLGGVTTNIKITPGGGAFNFAGFFTAAGTYTVKGKNAGNCSVAMTGNAVVTINDIPSGIGSISSATTTLCQGKSVDLTAVGFQNAVTYVWTLPSGLSTTSSTSGNSISVMGDAAPGGTVSVAARNNCGLSAAAQLPIVVNPLPILTINAPPASEQIVDDALSFTFESDISISGYVWDYGDGSTSTDASSDHTYTSEGQYSLSLLVKTTTGCEAGAGVKINIIQFPALSDNAIKNVVTANNDQKNDHLIVSNIERFPNNSLSVIDRWGVEVYNQDAYNNEWDFKKGGNYLPAGSYICIVRLNDSGKVITRTVTLIRK